MTIESITIKSENNSEIYVVERIGIYTEDNKKKYISNKMNSQTQAAHSTGTLRRISLDCELKELTVRSCV